MAKEYTVKFKFSTARAGKGVGSIVGDSGNGEIDITVNGNFDKSDVSNPDLIAGCKQHVRAQNNIKGAFVSFEIIEIIDKVK